MAKKDKKLTPGRREVAKKPFFTRFKWEILIFVFAALLYANSIPNNYNLDDELVTNNHRLTSRGISAIPDIFSSSYYKDESGYAYEYRPIVLSSFAIEHQFLGDSPYASHFINLILYAVCCVFLFRVLRLLVGEASLLLTLAITFIFVAHPAHTEVVASIKNRDEILALFFSLFALYTAVKANLQGNKWFLVPLPFIFSIALMSKLTSISFILIIPAVIILFTNAGFMGAMFTTLLLVIPSFFLINSMGDLYSKLIVELGLLAVVAVLYLIFHIQQAKAAIQNCVKLLRTPGSRDSGQVIFDGGTRYNFSGFFAGINPGSSYYSFKPILAVVLAVAIYFTGLISVHPSIMFAGFIALFFLLLWGNEKFAYWAGIMAYACLVFTLFKYRILLATGYGDIVSILLVYQLLFGNRKMLIPTIILLGFFIASSIVTSPITIVKLVFTAIVLPSRYRKILCLVFLMASAIDFYGGFHWGQWHYFAVGSHFYGDKFSLILIIAFILKWNVKYLVDAYKFIAILMLLFFIGNNPLTDVSSIKNQVQTTIVDYGKNNHTDVLPTEQDRPLLYLEQPVTARDPWQVRAGTSLEILFAYLHKVILPYPMAFYYGYRFIKPEKITDTVPLISLFLYLGLSILTFVFIRKDKLLALGLIIYLVSVAAASNYFMPVPGQLGERFLLIPSLGWSVILAVVLFRIFKIRAEEPVNWPSLNRGSGYVFAGIMLLYSTLTFSRNFDWKNDLTLFRHDINYVSQSAQAHNLLALHLMKKYVSLNDPAAQSELAVEALRHFKQSYRIYPSFFNVAFDIARVSALLNQQDSAIFYFNEAIKIDSSNADTYINLGKLLISEQKFSGAIPYLEHATKYSPLNYGGYENLSYAYFSIGEYQKSIEVNRTASRLLPAFTSSLVNISRTFYTMNQMDSARAYLQKALQINPNDPLANKVMMQLQANSKK